MNPLTILDNLLSGLSTENLKLVMFLCGLGAYVILMYVVGSGADRGFRVVRGRRWWR
jgi:hypothetical protein